MNSQYDVGLFWMIYISALMLVIPGLFALWYEHRHAEKEENKNHSEILPFPTEKENRPAA